MPEDFPWHQCSLLIERRSVATHPKKALMGLTYEALYMRRVVIHRTSLGSRSLEVANVQPGRATWGISDNGVFGSSEERCEGANLRAEQRTYARKNKEAVWPLLSEVAVSTGASVISSKR